MLHGRIGSSPGPLRQAYLPAGRLTHGGERPSPRVVQSQVPVVHRTRGGDRQPGPSSLGCRGHSCSVTWVVGVGEEAVCFLVDTVDGVRLRALGEAEDLSGLFIHPVPQVGHAVATLGAQVLVKVEYHLERVLSGEPDDNQLDVWWAELRRGTLVGEDEVAWKEFVNAILYRMDPYRSSLVGEAPFDVADAYSADTAYYYEHVFDVGGDLLPDVREAFEWLEGRAPVAPRRPGTATSPTTRLRQSPGGRFERGIHHLLLGSWIRTWSVPTPSWPPLREGLERYHPLVDERLEANAVVEASVWLQRG